MRILAYILLILVFGSCGPKPIHSESLNFENGWTYNDQLSTTIKIADTIQTYDLVTTVGHRENFGFENIYLKITTLFPSGEEKSSPLSLELASSKGIWNGKCSGEVCDLAFNLKEKFRFKEPGSYTFRLEQYSRLDTLNGINDLTLSLYQSKAE